MLELTVRAGSLERDRPLLVARVEAEALAAAGLESVLGRGPIGQETIGGACLLRPANGADPIVGQYDPMAQQLAFVLPDHLPAGRSRTYALAATTPADLAQETHPVSLIQKLDRVIFHVGTQSGDEAFATYNVHGGRRPYFWPVLGPSGASVVRGQGTGDHPHHTGMALNYGGHSEGGSSNIWSDWDEPPYGPGGRMLHRGFRRVQSGPVYGEVVEDLTYLNAYGDPIIDEVRTIRCWWASPQTRYLDFRFDVLSARDSGPQPFLFMIRLPSFFDIPTTGRVTNAAGQSVPPPKGESSQYAAAWVDASGPTGDPPPAPPAQPPETLPDAPGARPVRQRAGSGPWNGIAMFDHPDNDGFPGVVGKYAGGHGAAQFTQVHYPPKSAPQGPFVFRQRVYVHDGDAESAAVAARCADYGQPCQVDVRTT